LILFSSFLRYSSSSRDVLVVTIDVVVVTIDVIVVNRDVVVDTIDIVVVRKTL